MPGVCPGFAQGFAHASAHCSSNGSLTAAKPHSRQGRIKIQFWQRPLEALTRRTEKDAEEAEEDDDDEDDDHACLLPTLICTPHCHDGPQLLLMASKQPGGILPPPAAFSPVRRNTSRSDQTGNNCLLTPPGTFFHASPTIRGIRPGAAMGRGTGWGEGGGVGCGGVGWWWCCFWEAHGFWKVMAHALTTTLIKLTWVIILQVVSPISNLPF